MREGITIQDGTVVWKTTKARSTKELATTTQDGLMSKEDKIKLNGLNELYFGISATPSQANALSYTGTLQSPSLLNFNSNALSISGTTSATEVGTYTAVVTPAEGYTWSDGSTDSREVEWTIEKASIPIPTLNGTITYNGSSQSPIIDNYDNTKMTIGGVYKAINVGTYTASFSLGENYKWLDGTEEVKYVEWSIDTTTLNAYPSRNGTLTYNGSSQSPKWNDYNSEQLDISGDVSAINAGNYTATFTPKENYNWPDGTTEAKSFTWSISKSIINDIPRQSELLIYTGSLLSPTWDNYNENILDYAGDVGGINAGSYVGYFTPKSNYIWADGTVDPKEVSWLIGNSILTGVINQSNNITYDGTIKEPTWDNYDVNKMTIGGTIKGIDAGTYTATFTPKDNYQWADGTRGPINVNWVINQAGVTSLPSQSGTLTYDGTVKEPTWLGYDPDKLDIGGELFGTNAGSYHATFTPRGNYKWADGTNTSKTITWYINRAQNTFEIESTDILLTADNLLEEVGFTRTGGGSLQIINNQPSIATVTVNNDKLIFSANANGINTVLIKVLENNNYNQSEEIEVTIHVVLASYDLDKTSPDSIKTVTEQGLASTLWSVGDRTIKIYLNGFISDGLSLENYPARAYIIGIDHNSELEGENTLHFQIGIDEDNKKYAFVDRANGMLQTTGIWFNHKNEADNTGGWKDSNMRTICNNMFNALPEEWQIVIKSIHKYSDNTGSGSNPNNVINTTTDKLFLLSEYEIMGDSIYGNPAEALYQKQYDFYKANSAVRYKHNDDTTTATWWTRTSNIYSSNEYVFINSSGACASNNATGSRGFSPAFIIG